MHLLTPSSTQTLTALGMKVGGTVQQRAERLFLTKADIDNSGTLDYVEFVASMLYLNKVQKQDHLYADSPISTKTEVGTLLSLSSGRLVTRIMIPST